MKFVRLKLKLSGRPLEYKIRQVDSNAKIAVEGSCLNSIENQHARITHNFRKYEYKLLILFKQDFNYWSDISGFELRIAVPGLILRFGDSPSVSVAGQSVWVGSAQLLASFFFKLHKPFELLPLLLIHLVLFCLQFHAPLGLLVPIFPSLDCFIMVSCKDMISPIRVADCEATLSAWTKHLTLGSPREMAAVPRWYKSVMLLHMRGHITVASLVIAVLVFTVIRTTDLPETSSFGPIRISFFYSIYIY